MLNEERLDYTDVQICLLMHIPNRTNIPRMGEVKIRTNKNMNKIQIEENITIKYINSQPKSSEVQHKARQGRRTYYCLPHRLPS
jgi:hypothetical protein